MISYIIDSHNSQSGNIIYQTVYFNLMCSIREKCSTIIIIIILLVTLFVHNRVNILLSMRTQMKELLAELAMVEGEIARLEGQISQLQLGLKHEEATKEAKSKQWQHETLISNPVARASYISMPSPMNNKGERMGYETKALHFISKAIKGDYDHLNDLSLNEKIGSLRGIADQKENYFCDEVKFQNKVPRKNGILRASSPLRAPRYPSPKVLM